MNATKENNERLREACAFGDLETVSSLLRGNLTDVNSQHTINGWTPLHWAAKRGYSQIVSSLLEFGADPAITTNSGETPAQLTTDRTILSILGHDVSQVATGDNSDAKLPIVPNYITYPPFPYGVSGATSTEDPLRDGTLSHRTFAWASARVFFCFGFVGLVVKIRAENEPDFIEVDLPNRRSLTFHSFVDLCCSELGISPGSVSKVRKLPNTLVRNDRDVRRLTDMQEVDFVLRR